MSLFSFCNSAAVKITLPLIISSYQFIPLLHSSVYPSICLYLFIHFNCLSINADSYLFIHPSMNPLIHPSIYPMIDSYPPSIHQTIHPFTYLHQHIVIIYGSIHLYIHPSIPWLIHILHLFIHSCIYPSFIPPLPKVRLSALHPFFFIFSKISLSDS